MEKIDFETKCYKSNVDVFINRNNEFAECITIDFNDCKFDDYAEFVDYIDYEVQKSEYYSKINAKDVADDIYSSFAELIG